MEAARRIDEWSRIELEDARTSAWCRGCRRRSSRAGAARSVPFEWEVLAAVDGQRDLHALADALGRSEFDVARTVFGLTDAGVVVLDDPARPGSGAGGRPRSRRAARAGARGPGAGAVRAWPPARCEELLRARSAACRRRAGCSASARRRSAALPRRVGDLGLPGRRLGPAHAGRRGASCRRWSACDRAVETLDEGAGALP